MQRIKVIHLWKDLDTYYGVHDQLLTLGKYIDRTRFDYSIAVFDRRENEISKRFRDAGISIHDLGLPGKQNPMNIIGLARFLRRERPHVLHTYCLNTNIFGILSGRLAGVPVIIPTELTQRDQAPTAAARLRDAALNRIKNKLSNFADCQVFVSNNVKDNWVGERYSHQYRIVYPPFNLEKYGPFENTPLRFPRKAGEFTIGVVARLSEEKRHTDLLDAMGVISRQENARLVIVGTGPTENDLKARAVELGIAERVRFTGYRNNVFEELQYFDIFVLPSRSEGLPISIVEAMAMGLPVVATRVGGIPEAVVDGETGILVPVRSPEILAQSILHLIRNPYKAESMGRAGKDRAMSLFHPGEFARKHAELYSELVLAKKPEMFV